jgi:hypothetical protein
MKIPLVAATNVQLANFTFQESKQRIVHHSGLER